MCEIHKVYKDSRYIYYGKRTCILVNRLKYEHRMKQTYKVRRTYLTARSRSQSLKMINGDFPPSSRDTFFTLLFAALKSHCHNQYSLDSVSTYYLTSLPKTYHYTWVAWG